MPLESVFSVYFSILTNAVCEMFPFAEFLTLELSSIVKRLGLPFLQRLPTAPGFPDRTIHALINTHHAFDYIVCYDSTCQNFTSCVENTYGIAVFDLFFSRIFKGWYKSARDWQRHTCHVNVFDFVVNANDRMDAGLTCEIPPVFCFIPSHSIGSNPARIRPTIVVVHFAIVSE